MRDITSRARWVFWGFALTAFFLAAVPSFVLIEKFSDYYRFLTRWDPGTLKPLSVKGLPHQSPREPAGSKSALGGASSSGTLSREEPEIHFIEFSLTAPKAKSVALSASFNQWRPETLPLKKQANGVWLILVPLLPGKYSYAFVVDGAWTLDPKVSAQSRMAGRMASFLSVP